MLQWEVTEESGCKTDKPTGKEVVVAVTGAAAATAEGCEVVGFLSPRPTVEATSGGFEMPGSRRSLQAPRDNW